jgi:hypothetical protein
VFTKPPPLGKTHTVVRVPWHLNYWAIDKDAPKKVSPIPVKSMIASLNIGNANSKYDIASHWLPKAATLTIVNSNQPEPLMELPISIAHDSMQYHTSVLIDSATT